MPPKWARLIKLYQADGHVGLTPSFLVGALREPYGNIADAPTSFADLRTLIESMRDEHGPYGRVVKVFECRKINQPVVALSSDTHGTPIASPGQPARLYVWPWHEPERPGDFDWLLGALWCHFRAPICDGRFSYRPTTRSFTEFDPHDREFIQKALRNEDGALT